MYAGSGCEKITGRMNIDVELKLQTTRILAPSRLTKLATQILKFTLMVGGGEEHMMGREGGL